MDKFFLTTCKPFVAQKEIIVAGSFFFSLFLPFSSFCQHLVKIFCFLSHSKLELGRDWSGEERRGEGESKGMKEGRECERKGGMRSVGGKDEWERG